jgi:hypothetical protein
MCLRKCNPGLSGSIDGSGLPLSSRDSVGLGALQAAQAQKEQTVDKALVVARVQQQKVATLLAPTEHKEPISCEEAMPDVRAILKGITQ